MKRNPEDADRQELYNEEYFQKHCGPIPYDRNQPHWMQLFNNVADQIIQIINPRSVLDIGCGKGFLVEALRDRGVEAYGIDVSVYAISQVRDDIKQFCRIGSVIDPIDRDYDSITCIEVLEHVTEEEGKTAIYNMANRTQNILFSSTPSDIYEPTHINIHPVIYWLELFSKFGFYPDITVDVGFIAPQAFLLRKRDPNQSKDFLYFFARSIGTKIELIAKGHTLAEKDRLLAELQATIREQRQELNRIHATLGWKFLNKCEQFRDNIFPIHTRRRKIYNVILKSIKIVINEGWLGFFNMNLADDYPYKLWILKNEPHKAQLNEMRIESRSWSYRPKVGIITPVYNPNKYDLTQCIKSVLDQVYDNWEFCLVDGGSDKPYVKEVISKFALKDPRIKSVSLPKNLGIVGNSNEALKLATGEFVGLLDHDDMLAPFALYEVVKLLNQNPTIDFVYSDEDKIPARSRKRYNPFFKPEWSPDTFLSYNYLCHFAVVRKRIIDEIGGFREGYDGSQDYDLILRIIQKTNRIKRISKILYHWRASNTSAAWDMKAKLYAYPAAKKAIMEYLGNRGLEAEVLDGWALGAYRVKYRIRPSQKVCIIIPTKDKVHLLKKCVYSILDKTNYNDFNILIVDNQSREQATYDFFNSSKYDEKIRIVKYDEPFNFSAINNFGVRSTDSEYLLFLNNDTEVISNEWLTAMLEFAQREDVGAVGAKLYHTNDTIQHGGVIIGMGGVAAHAHRDFLRSSQGYMGRLKIVQNLSAVTAACMMMRRSVFEEVGGFDETLSHAFNDVDLCLKLREKGYLIVYTPYAELYHRESVSRGYDLDTPEGKARFTKEVEIMQSRWKHILETGDPYYNPNLTLDKPDFSIRL